MPTDDEILRDVERVASRFHRRSRIAHEILEYHTLRGTDPGPALQRAREAADAREAMEDNRIPARVYFRPADELASTPPAPLGAVHVDDVDLDAELARDGRDVEDATRGGHAA